MKIRSKCLRVISIVLCAALLCTALSSLSAGAAVNGKPSVIQAEFKDIPSSIYWAVVTITTVGYGDIAPVTHTGRFVSILVMLLGYSIIAVPTGIVAGETIEEYKQQRQHHRRNRNHRRPEADNYATTAKINTSGPAYTDDGETPPLSSSTRKSWDDDPGARITPEDLL